MATSSLPVWLLDSKEEITNSYQWPNFLQELYEALQVQLRESHVDQFSSLTEAERSLFMERATRAISGSQSYTDLYKKVSNALDRQLNNEVGRQLMEDQPSDTRTDLILDTAQEGVVGLLRKWPDLKSKLHVCLNQPLSDTMRPVAWRLFLQNPKVKKTYAQTQVANPRAAKSQRDLEISQKCQELLLSDAILEDVKSSTGAYYAMKAGLSYYDAVLGRQHALSDAHYRLIAPLLLVCAPNLPRKEPAPGAVVSVLIEEYFAFMASLPSFVNDSIEQINDEQIKTFGALVAGHLRHIGPESATAISEAFAPAKDQVLSSEGSSKAILTDAVTALFKPVIRNMFVGHVNKEVLLYIWDQYIIGLDSPGFSDEYLPAVTAVFFKLLGDKLKSCTTPARMEVCLKTEGSRLTVKQFQYEMNKYFYLDLSSRLKQHDRGTQPVSDPAQAVYPAWQSWFASQRLAGPTTAHDRRTERDAREAERQRLLLLKSDDLRKQRRDDEERFLEQQAAYQRRNEEDRQYMEARLAEERKRASEEIELLTRKIYELQRDQQMREMAVADSRASVRRPSSSVSLQSYSQYLIPSRPSEADMATPRGPPDLRASLPGTPTEQQSNGALLDLLKKMSYSFQKVAHGEGYQRQRLDEETLNNIRTHSDDVKAAEIEVLGHALREGEFEELSEQEREEKSDAIMDLIRTKIMQRRQGQLSNIR